MAAALPFVQAGGSILSGVGEAQADNAEAVAELENASFFREQERFTIEAAKREEDIFKDEADDLTGAQVSSFAKAGIELQGSPMMKLAKTQGKIDAEISAIRKERDFRTKLLRRQADDAKSRAFELSSPGRRLARGLGSILGAGTALAGGD